MTARSVWATTLIILALAGCGQQAGQHAGSPSVVTKNAKDHGHVHERGKMLIADAGPYHALLTAHLSSKDGHELDIFFETVDSKSPKPVPLPLESFTAQGTAGEEAKELKFEPAPKNERKG